MKTLPTLLLASIAFSSCAQPSQVTHLSGTSPLVEKFTRAASEVDMPADVLALWAHMETRFVAHGFVEDHGPRVYGVMGLNDALAEQAASLLGVDVRQVRDDEKTNIRAAAALVRNVADGTGHVEGRLTATSAPLAWLEAMARAREVKPKSLEDGYVDVAADALGRGEHGRDARGNTIIIEGRGKISTPPRTVITNALNPQDPYSAQFIASPNYTSGRTQTLDTVVIHDTEGSYNGTISWFQDTASMVSAHFVVRSVDGQITQMVNVEDTAWHVRTENPHCVGIEHEGYAQPTPEQAMTNWYNDVLYMKSAQLTRWLCDTYNIPMDRQHIVGHSELPNNTHHDPGPLWDWNRYMTYVTGSAPVMTDRRLVGVVYDATQSTSARIAGATVTLMNGSDVVGTTTSSATGFWAFDVTQGTYTVKAVASGFAENSRMGAASTTGDNWASIGLTPGGAPATGTIRGFVYEGEMAGQDPVDGATVTLSTGETMTVGPDGAFRFDIPAATVTVTAHKDGYVDGSLMRSVTAGATVWASIQIKPDMVMPPQDPPPTPNPISPTGDAQVEGDAVRLSFSRVTDPNALEVTYDVELYVGTAGGSPLFVLGAAQSATSPVNVDVPVALDPGAYSWRVRAHSSAGDSAYSDRALFTVIPPVVASSSSSASTMASSAGESSSMEVPTESGSSSSSSTGGHTQSNDQTPTGGTSNDDDNSNPTVGGCSASSSEGTALPLHAAGLLMLAALVLRRRK